MPDQELGTVSVCGRSDAVILHPGRIRTERKSSKKLETDDGDDVLKNDPFWQSLCMVSSKGEDDALFEKVRRSRAVLAASIRRSRTTPRLDAVEKVPAENTTSASETESEVPDHSDPEQALLFSFEVNLCVWKNFVLSTACALG